MRVTANLATHKARRKVLPRAIASICEQVDIVRVYCNDYEPDSVLVSKFDNVRFYTGEDYTDRAKFYWLQEDEYYFTIDDDIKYPEWYVEHTLSYLKDNPQTIYTYHGRKLQGTGVNYYFGHTQYHFLREVKQDVRIDVPGTGCSAFDSRYVQPDIMQYDEDCMADLLLGIEAAKNDWPVVCLAHDMHDLLTLWHPSKDSIYNEFARDCDRQNQLADQIWELKESVRGLVN